MSKENKQNTNNMINRKGEQAYEKHYVFVGGGELKGIQGYLEHQGYNVASDETTQHIEEWQSWFLGTDDEGKPKKWAAGRFRQRVLNVSMKELGNLYPKTAFFLTTEKEGRKIVGYTLDITPIKTTLNI